MWLVCYREQELQDANGPQEQGRMPRTIEVELTGSLVAAAFVGDAVTVLGWVKAIATDPVAAGSAPALLSSASHPSLRWCTK